MSSVTAGAARAIVRQSRAALLGPHGVLISWQGVLLLVRLTMMSDVMRNLIQIAARRRKIIQLGQVSRPVQIT